MSEPSRFDLVLRIWDLSAEIFVACSPGHHIPVVLDFDTPPLSVRSDNIQIDTARVRQ